MELRDYLKIIRKRIALLVLVTLLAGIFSFGWAYYKKPVSSASFSITLTKESEQTQKAADFYQYDSFYNLQAASLFVNNIKGWLRSPAVVAEIYQKSGLEPVSRDNASLVRFFRLNHEPASAVLEVSFQERDNEAAQKLTKATQDVLAEKVASPFQLDFIEENISANKPNLTNNTVVGLVVGFILGLILVFFKEYWEGSGKVN
ncbi:hypothetical protein HYU72_01480 [Candidatus Berkelbacteria bacterium]|nr:hypothetical protein [Candidatus Berkelbacteria bacterium]